MKTLPYPAILLAAALIFPLLHAPAASATPYWGPQEIDAYMQRLQIPAGAEPPDGPATLQLREQASPTPTYLQELGLIAQFLKGMQVATGVDSGGIREGEHMLNVIQTDNTSEAIWVWCRYYELTGDNQYFQNVIDAFEYSLRFPAYSEENGSTPQYGYYRMYNCGWATRAELKFRRTYFDQRFRAYGDSCASYIAHHTLVRPGSSFYNYVNPPVLSWALGNLYYVGQQTGNPQWMTYAAQEAEAKVKPWIEGEPTLLGNQTWAMSGGATMWGFVNSYLAAHPESTATWLPRYKGFMDTSSDPGDFTNAWNGWYALGHRSVGLALRDPQHLAVHIDLTSFLRAEDADEDGGVPARPEDTDLMDQSWVSNYLAFMGLSDCLGIQSGLDPSWTPEDGPSLLCFPNPFRGTATISVDLPAPSLLSAAVHDATGRQVRLLRSGFAPAGRLDLFWDGRASTGRMAPSGGYWVTVRTEDGAVTLRIVRIE